MLQPKPFRYARSTLKGYHAAMAGVSVNQLINKRR